MNRRLSIFVFILFFALFGGTILNIFQFWLFYDFQWYEIEKYYSESSVVFSFILCAIIVTIHTALFLMTKKYGIYIDYILIMLDICSSVYWIVQLIKKRKIYNYAFDKGQLTNSTMTILLLILWANVIVYLIVVIINFLLILFKKGNEHKIVLFND